MPGTNAPPDRSRPPLEMFHPLDGRPLLLALRALKLGDLLVAVPALKGLARAFDDHAVVYAAPGWLGPIVALVPGVDALPTDGLDAPLDVAPGAVDIAANLHGNGLESRALIDALHARQVIRHAPDPGVDPAKRRDPREPDWLDGILERRRWVRLVNAFGADAHEDDTSILTPAAPPLVAGAVVVHVGAFSPSRQWPVERFAAVASELSAWGAPVVVTGGDADRDRAGAVVRRAGLGPEAMLAGGLPLDGLASLIAAARLVVSADTGAAHLASAYGTPSVVIFGAAPVEEWGPPPGPHVVLTDASQRRGDAFADSPDPALLAVSAADVLSAAGELLDVPVPSRRDRPRPEEAAQFRERRDQQP